MPSLAIGLAEREPLTLYHMSGDEVLPLGVKDRLTSTPGRHQPNMERLIHHVQLNWLHATGYS